jgi:glycyl-tRNA synthetase
VETSVGLDRTFLAVLSHAYTEEKLEDGSDRVVLNLPPMIAPYKVAVLPLVAKDSLPEKAREIMDTLKLNFQCAYEEKDSIGRRYRRQDAIGTPYCITIDNESIENNTVTIRDRDTMKQERIAIEKITEVVNRRLGV